MELESTPKVELELAPDQINPKGQLFIHQNLLQRVQYFAYIGKLNTSSNWHRKPNGLITTVTLLPYIKILRA